MVIIRKQKKTANTILESAQRAELQSSVMALHSNRSQDRRKDALSSLKRRDAARRNDVLIVPLVVNWQMSDAIEAYARRTGPIHFLVLPSACK
ncbi:hypothetical protein [Phaffia rhodozyma]|uniref:Uncharacterized protein n=1 Tax=Phaffia rhodozyma TaxID=264483 RepID=A0A0F7SED2_PHARH|nr:hypothetical protein [Phaffia rhodozyma]